MAQEKSRAVLITPDRAVRSRVLAILRVTPFEALLHDRELDAIDFDPCFMHVSLSSFC